MKGQGDLIVLEEEDTGDLFPNTFKYAMETMFHYSAYHLILLPPSENICTF
jgi:hypothetical protein